MEKAFVHESIQMVLLESLEYISDMPLVFVEVVSVYEDVVQVNEDQNVEEIREDVIHEALKCCWRVGESEGYHTPLKGSVSGLEGGFPFVTFMDSNEMLGMLEINFGEYPSLLRTVKEVSHLGEWVMILLHNFVEPLEVNAKLKRAVLFTSE